MPTYINKFFLPKAFYRAVVNDPYSRGGSDFSATSLQNPARATILFERHGDEIEIDVSTRVATLMGQGTHSILERAAGPDDIFEKRFFASITVGERVYSVSAQIDLYESESKQLSDWKTTKTFAFHKKSGTAKPEWVQQLNVGAYLMSLSGHEVKSLQIIGLLKDWDYRKAISEPGYPPTEVMALDIDMWSGEKTHEWIVGRIKAIEDARVSLPECTSKEMWGGNRCARWCDVSSVCDQYQKTRRTGLI